jgi:hypothetical protein
MPAFVIPPYRSGQFRPGVNPNARLDFQKVAIPPYRSGQFRRGRSSRLGELLRAGLSQSLRTDQGNSDGWTLCMDRDGSLSSRNPSVPIRAIPTPRPVRFIVWLDALVEVAIPPYRSGQFRRQQHRDIDLRSNQLGPVAIPPYRSGQFRQRKVEPDPEGEEEVAIPPYRSGQFRQRIPGSCSRPRPSRNPSVPIRAIPTQDVRGSATVRDLWGRNPSVPIRAIPTCRGGAEGPRPPLRRLVAIPPYRSGQFRRRQPDLDRPDLPPVAIPPYRSGQFRLHVKKGKDGRPVLRRNPSVPIRAIPTSSPAPSSPTPTSRRNPSVPIRAIPT